MSSIIKRSFIVILILTVGWNFAGSQEHSNVDIFGGAWVAGLSMRMVSLSVSDPNALEDLGELSTNIALIPFVGISTPEFYFGDSNWGYYFTASMAILDIDTQYTDDNTVDLGTAVRGFYAYGCPVFFYLFGDKINSIEKGYSFKVGLGAGIGYVRAKGDIILTETAPQDLHNFNINKFSILTMEMFYEIQYNHFFIRLGGGGPVVRRGSYEYWVMDVYFDVGYIERF